MVDQATVGHDRAGSKGNARIFRLGYADPLYVAMARRAERAWRLLEDETGTSLLRTTGQVTFGEGLASLTDAMGAAGAPFEALPGEEVQRRFPALAVEGPAVWEPASGVLAADRCLAALGDGLDVVEGERVQAIADDGRSVRVRTDRRDFVAPVAVVCAGAWMSTALRDLGCATPMFASLEQVAYFESGGDDIPVFMRRSHSSFYGLPIDGQIKSGFHVAGGSVDPSSVALADDPDAVESLHQALQRVLPARAHPLVRAERCFYDNTPDEDFVLDRLGRVVVGGGTSGHGFKFGAYLGEVLADLALGVQPSVDVSRFRADRVMSDRRASL